MRNATVLLLLAAMTLGAASMAPVAPKDGPVGIQFVVRVIEASSAPGAPNDAADKVPAELKEILKHTAYSQVGVVILRGRDAEFSLGSLVGEIDAEIIQRAGEQLIEFDIELAEKVITVDDEGEKETDWKGIIETSDIARDGETIVLGASTIRGGAKSMIVLMTVKLIR